MSYENSNPITDKFNFPDGSIRQLDGTIIQQANDFNEQRYNQAEPIPNKFLHSDGTIKDKDGNVIEQTSEFNVKRYNQAVPIPAKFLHSDGTVDENIGSGGTSLEYKLYAWEVSIDHTTIGYTEVEEVEVGDVLLIPENTGVGPITDTNQLKKKGLVKSVSEGHITVEIEEGHEIVFERNTENDWTETITDVKGTLDVSQNGLLIAEKGKVMKAIDIAVGGGGFESYKKLYGFSRLDFIEWSVEKYEDDDPTYHPVSIDGYSYMWYLTHKEITNITPGSYTPTIYVDIYRQILEQDNTAVMVAFDSGGYFMIPFLDGFLSL